MPVESLKLVLFVPQRAFSKAIVASRFGFVSGPEFGGCSFQFSERSICVIDSFA